MIDTTAILGHGVSIPHPDLVNLYDCHIGDHSQVSPFVEIGGGAIIGSYVRIRNGVTLGGYLVIEDYVFIGNGTQHSNDVYPMAYTHKSNPTHKWVYIRHHSTLGINVTILPGVEVGPYAFVGAGTVITKDVEPFSIVIGNPMWVLHQFRNKQEYYDHLGGDPDGERMHYVAVPG